MHILLTGATGFVGQALSAHLTAAGHHLTPLLRTPSPTPSQPSWNPSSNLIQLPDSPAFDAVIHLAGETIAQRWTTAARHRIQSSRIQATQLLCHTLARLPNPPPIVLCASATGYYGNRGNETLPESASPGTGFLAETCVRWEASTQPAMDRGLRVANLRFGIVLHPRGGALARMLPIFKLGLGGRLGPGTQSLSWITLQDLLRAIQHVLLSPSLAGPINMVAPSPVTNTHFTSALARALHRPALLPVPTSLISLLLGHMGRETLLASTRAVPSRLLDSRFQFTHPNLDTALSQILSPQPWQTSTSCQ